MGEFYIVTEDASELFFVDGLGAFLFEDMVREKIYYCYRIVRWR